MRAFRIFMALALILILGLSIGSFFHWLYWNMMVLASKMVFGLLFAIPVIIVVGLIYLLFRKSNKT